MCQAVIGQLLNVRMNGLLPKDIEKLTLLLYTKFYNSRKVLLLSKKLYNKQKYVTLFKKIKNN